MRLHHLRLLLVVTFACAIPGPSWAEDSRTVVDWQLDNLRSIGGHAVTVLGKPRVVQTPMGPALEFDGSTDGILLDVNPLVGLQRFTVEVLFEPAPDGPPEQRFLHVEEEGGARRALLETRMLPGGHWALDTFLKDGDVGVTLLERTRQHAAGEWHTAALVYDGREMSHFVDGVRELAGRLAFGPMSMGRTSIGVRQNKVYWFKGRIARVRVTAGALGPDQFIPRSGSTGSRIERDADVAVDQPGTHDGGGMTTGFPFFGDVDDMPFYFRKRALRPGSGIGYHRQEQDEVYYVLSGSGEYTLDGRTVTVGPGTAMLTRKGSSHALKQTGAEDLVIIIAYPRAPSR